MTDEATVGKFWVWAPCLKVRNVEVAARKCAVSEGGGGDSAAPQKALKPKLCSVSALVRV